MDNSYLDTLALGFNSDFNTLAEEASSSLSPGGAAPNRQQQQQQQPQQQQQQQQQQLHPQERHHQNSNVTVYQTTGPDAHTGPIPDDSGAPAINPRSCVTCRRRKVRCDKQMPCSNCRRAQIPCVFPAPGRAPRQPRPRDPNAPSKNSSQRELELMKRLRKLEGIVEDLSGQIEVEPGEKGPSAASSPEAAQLGTVERASSAQHRQSSASVLGLGSPRVSEGANSEPGDAVRKKELHKKFGRLVLDDSGTKTRYVSSGFWAKLTDELDSIRKDCKKMTDEESDYEYEDTPEAPPADVVTTADHQSFIFGYRSADVDLSKCHPPTSQVPYLWSVFQDYIDPMIKILHVPSVEAVFRDVRKSPSQLTPGQVALVFVIYFSAITALEPSEVQQNLGASRDELLVQFRFAAEQALAKADLLLTSDMTVLQAFVIFLAVVRATDRTRFSSSLAGLAIHLGQVMGLHRDGSHFGLSPFETEARRRLWWQLVQLDVACADELGTDLIIPENNFDTQLPSNINDDDFSPSSAELPEPRVGASDTAVSLVRCEIVNLTKRFVRISGAQGATHQDSSAFNAASLAEREALLVDMYQRIESKFLQHVVNETDPLYWMAAMITRVIMAKMCLVIYQPLLFPGTDQDLTEDARKRTYVSSIEIIEYNHILNTDPRCKQFRWLFTTYTNWHAVAYYLIESCRRPWTALVERGWQSLNGFIGDPTQFAKKTRVAAMLPLRKLCQRANRRRLSELARLRADPEEARRLDFEERMDSSSARFGTVPGAADRMEEVRQQWRLMVQPNSNMPPMASSTIEAAARAMLPTPGRSAQQAVTPASTASPTNDGTSPQAQTVMSNAMNLVDDLMSRGSAFPMTGLWPLAGTAEEEALQGSHLLMGTGASPSLATNTTPSPGGIYGQAAQQQQQQQPPMELPKDDYPPPYLWSGNFLSQPSSDLSGGGEDIDMLADGFDWHDWSQSIKGLEVESAQGGTHNW